MKKILTIVVLFFFLAGCSRSTAQKPSVVINNHRLKIDIADNDRDRARGLSGRTSLCEDCGMLFVFQEREVQNFWMKDMGFPLDIIWIDKDTIVKIDKNLAAEGSVPLNIYTSDQPVDYVLEINSGKSESLGFKVNDKVKYEL